MKANFEDLLNEFDDDYIPQNKSVSKPNTNVHSSDIDSLFEELKDIEKVEPLKIAAPMPRVLEERVKKFEKCYPVMVSGLNRLGYCMSSANQVACDKLRCTRCDLPVKRFQGKIWKPEAEYLFFRNNFSRDDRLMTMANNCEGAAAYSCQCAWKNAKEPVSINGDSWVCGGHYV